MFFSGHNIIIATLADLKEELDSAETVIWSGESAGGMGCFNSVDFVHDALPNALVVGLPVGGFYFSNEWPYAGTEDYPVDESYIPWTFDDLADYMKLWDAFVPPRCLKDQSQDAHKCLIAEGLYPSLESPVFVVEAQTDEIVMPLHDGLPSVWSDSPYPCYNEVDNCPEEVRECVRMRSGRRDLCRLVALLVASTVLT